MGKCIKAAKIGEKFKILKFWRMKIEKTFGEQMKLGTFSRESEKLTEIGAKSETGGNASLPHGDGRSCSPPLSSENLSWLRLGTLRTFLDCM